jgi:hypothetical protein
MRKKVLVRDHLQVRSEQVVILTATASQQEQSEL